MQSQHRPSILHRPAAKNWGKANVESAEAQYEREQDLLRAKAQRQRDTRDRMQRSFYPTAADKAAAYQEQLNALQHLGRDTKSAPDVTGPSYVAMASSAALRVTDRPWHSSVSTLNVEQDEEEAARRRFAAEVAAENYRLMQERQAHSARMQQVEQQEAARAATMHRDTYFGSLGMQAPQQNSQRLPQSAASSQPPWATHAAQAPQVTRTQPQPAKEYP